MLSVELISQPARKLVGLELIGPDSPTAIPDLWQAFMPRMGEVARVKDTFGASHMTADGKIAYLCGSEVANFDQIPEGMTGWDVVGGTYALVKCPSLGEIHHAIDWFYQDWLPTSDHNAGQGMLEYYPPEFPGNPSFDLLFSVVPRVDSEA